MTISALCMFCSDLPGSNPDAAAEALRAAGYQVFRLPPELKAATCEEGHDFIEIHREGNDDEDAIAAMWADAQRIVGPFEGDVDCVGAASEELFLELTGMLDTRPCCAHCGYRGTPDRPLLLIFSQRHVWLHNDDCLRPWLDTLVEAGPRLDTLVDPEAELITEIEAEVDTLVEEEF